MDILLSISPGKGSGRTKSDPEGGNYKGTKGEHQRAGGQGSHDHQPVDALIRSYTLIDVGLIGRGGPGGTGWEPWKGEIPDSSSWGGS